MSDRKKKTDERLPPDHAEVEAVEAGDVEPGPPAEETARAAEREQEALEG